MAGLIKQINRYQIKACPDGGRDVLGCGGMALVYRAYAPHFKREVAIKVMAAHLLHEPQFRQRSSREAQVIASRKLRRLCLFMILRQAQDKLWGAEWAVLFGDGAMGLMSGGSLASYNKALALNNNAAARQMSQAGLDRLGVEG